MSTSMDAFLAHVYGTKTAAAQSNQEDLEKEASVQLFMKLAGEQNIDLASMPDAQVNELYQVWRDKTAAAEPPAEPTATEPTAPAKVAEDDAEKKKREEAEKEHEEKKAAAEKVAEADFLGRVMAHAYVNELNKIASTGEPPAEPTATTPTEPAEDKTAGKMPEALRKGLEAARGAAGKAADKGKELAGKAGDAAKKHKGHAAAAAGGAAAGGAAGFMAGKSKKASAIDELATDRAVIMAHEAGLDPEEAGRKVAAVRELGMLGESEKVAHAANVDAAIGIRALELLEAAGYEVTWNNQQ